MNEGRRRMDRTTRTLQEAAKPGQIIRMTEEEFFGRMIKRDGTTEFTEDKPELIGTGAVKYDGGKPCVFRGAVQYFPRAINAVAEISTFGAKKYAWAGWENVDDGINRYSDAMARHMLKEAMGEEDDPDSGMLHAAHLAWGALARLELILREKEIKDANF